MIDKFDKPSVKLTNDLRMYDIRNIIMEKTASRSVL